MGTSAYSYYAVKQKGARIAAFFNFCQNFMNNLVDFHDSDARFLNTVLDWVRWGSSQFSEAGLYFGHGTQTSWDEALYLVCWCIDQPWDAFDKIQHAALTATEKEKIYRLYMRRIGERVPAPYLTGVAWFAGLPYKVTPDVLVPRSPIAELILNSFEPWLDNPPHTILDLCTGSACIGITCAHQFGQASVDVSDISEPALNVAHKNVEFHQVQDRVNIVHSDGFENLQGRSYDLIVSNPPYVDDDDFASMPKEYHAEPKLGLTSGADGLDFTRRLLKEAALFLNDGGLLVVEVGNSYVALEAAYPNVPFTWPDLEHGGHGVFILTKQQLQQYF